MGEVRIAAITGRPGVGKTTAAVAAAKAMRSLGYSVDGFYSREVREGASRRGFEIVDFLTGEREVLADVRGEGPRIGKYRVNLKGIEEFVPRIVDRALASAQVVLCDEVGPMELLSPSFKRGVYRLLEAKDKMLIIVLHRSVRDPLAKAIREDPRAAIIEVDELNRDEVPSEVVELLTGGRGEGLARGWP